MTEPNHAKVAGLKASNALVAVTDFYASLLAGLEAESQARQPKAVHEFVSFQKKVTTHLGELQQIINENDEAKTVGTRRVINRLRLLVQDFKENP